MIETKIHMYIRIVRMHVRMYVRMHVCMYVRMYACMYVCVYVGNICIACAQIIYK